MKSAWTTIHSFIGHERAREGKRWRVESWGQAILSISHLYLWSTGHNLQIFFSFHIQLSSDKLRFEPRCDFMSKIGEMNVSHISRIRVPLISLHNRKIFTKHVNSFPILLVFGCTLDIIISSTLTHLLLDAIDQSTLRYFPYEKVFPIKRNSCSSITGACSARLSKSIQTTL